MEQWIEGVFPVPKDPAVIARRQQIERTGETPEESSAARKEMMILIGAVILTLTIISALMVFTPCLFNFHTLISSRFSLHG